MSDNMVRLCVGQYGRTLLPGRLGPLGHVGSFNKWCRVPTRIRNGQTDGGAIRKLLANGGDINTVDEKR